MRNKDLDADNLTKQQNNAWSSDEVKNPEFIVFPIRLPPKQQNGNNRTMVDLTVV